MATSPQTSAAHYFHRMKQEAFWNRRERKAEEPHDLTLLPVLNEADLQPEPPTDLWFVGSPQLEAKEFFEMLQRNGHTVEELRADIGISPAEMLQLDRWCEQEPCLAWRIRKMVSYRQQVLAGFNSLVENGGTSNVQFTNLTLRNSSSPPR